MTPMNHLTNDITHSAHSNAIPCVGKASQLRYRVIGYRLYRKWTQAQLADRAGYSREYISMIENGRRNVVKHKVLTALATALGIDITALTTKQPGTLPTDEEQALVLRLNLWQIHATLAPTTGPNPHQAAIHLTDGVLRIELVPGPLDHAKQNRNAAARITEIVNSYLRSKNNFSLEAANIQQ